MSFSYFFRMRESNFQFKCQPYVGHTKLGGNRRDICRFSSLKQMMAFHLSLFTSNSNEEPKQSRQRVAANFSFHQFKK